MYFSLARISPIKGNSMICKEIQEIYLLSCNGLHDRKFCFGNYLAKTFLRSLSALDSGGRHSFAMRRHAQCLHLNVGLLRAPCRSLQAPHLFDHCGCLQWMLMLLWFGPALSRRSLTATLAQAESHSLKRVGPI